MIDYKKLLKNNNLIHKAKGEKLMIYNNNFELNSNCYPKIVNGNDVNRALLIFEGSWQYYIEDIIIVLKSGKSNHFYLDVGRGYYVNKSDIAELKIIKPYII
jgi:hypothetical protein